MSGSPRTRQSGDRPAGTLIIIGGHEQKRAGEHRTILEEVARRAREGKGTLLIIAAASRIPEEYVSEYRTVFNDLDVPQVESLDLEHRQDAYDDEAVRRIEQADVIFFTGGDQLRITSQLGGTPAFDCLCRVYHAGATVAGTSAGAAAMPGTMLVAGPGDTSYDFSALNMSPGLGLIEGVVIDSHFAERGRFGRLLGAVTENPRNLGIGIDENTALIVPPDGIARVAGSGAVYVMDGSGITYTSLSEAHSSGTVSTFGVQLHVLSEDDRFDLANRTPLPPDRTSE